MRHVLLKVYGAFSPADNSCLASVLQAGEGAIPNTGPDAEPGTGQDAGGWAFLQGDMLRLSWEGVYFPLEEAVDALARSLPEGAEGRLDYIDLESWTLTRHILRDGAFTASTRSLNHVLDHAGH